MSQRPVSVTVLSIIGLILGGLGVVCGGWNMVSAFADLQRGNPMIDAMHASPYYKPYIGVSGCFGLGVTVILIVSCIGSLNLKPWARMGMNVYAVLSILQAIAAVVISTVWIIPLMLENVPADTPPAVRTGMRIGAYVSPCFILLMLIYPVCVLIFFNRKKVANAFRGIFEPSPTNFPMDPQSPPQ